MRVLVLVMVPLLFAWSVDLGSPILRVVFSGNRLAAVTYNGYAYIFDLNGDEVLEEKIGNVGISLYAFGEVFAFESDEGIYLFNSYGKEIGFIEIPEGFHGSLVHNVVFLLLAGKKIGVFYVDYSNNLALTELWSLKGLSGVAPSALADSENYIIVGDYNGYAYLLKPSGEVEYRIKVGSNIFSIDVCDQYLAIGGKGIVLLYNLNEKPEFLGKMKVAGIAMVSFNDYCDKLAISDSEGKLLIVDLESKNVTTSDLEVSPISLDWRCNQIAIGSREGKLVVLSPLQASTKLVEGTKEIKEEVKVNVLGNLTG